MIELLTVSGKRPFAVVVRSIMIAVLSLGLVLLGCPLGQSIEDIPVYQRRPVKETTEDMTFQVGDDVWAVGPPVFVALGTMLGGQFSPAGTRAIISFVPRPENLGAVRKRIEWGQVLEPNAKRQLLILDTETGKTVPLGGAFDGRYEDIDGLGWLGDDTLVVKTQSIPKSSQVLYLYDARTGTLKAEVQTAVGRGLFLFGTPRGTVSMFLAGEPDGTVKFMALSREGQIAEVLRSAPGLVPSVLPSADQDSLLAGRAGDWKKFKMTSMPPKESMVTDADIKAASEAGNAMTKRNRFTSIPLGKEGKALRMLTSEDKSLRDLNSSVVVAKEILWIENDRSLVYCADQLTFMRPLARLSNEAKQRALEEAEKRVLSEWAKKVLSEWLSFKGQTEDLGQPASFPAQKIFEKSPFIDRLTWVGSDAALAKLRGDLLEATVDSKGKVLFRKR